MPLVRYPTVLGESVYIFTALPCFQGVVCAVPAAYSCHQQRSPHLSTVKAVIPIVPTPITTTARPSQMWSRSGRGRDERRVGVDRKGKIDGVVSNVVQGEGGAKA